MNSVVLLSVHNSMFRARLLNTAPLLSGIMVKAFSVIFMFLVLQAEANAQSPSLAPSNELGVQEANLLFKHLVSESELEASRLPIELSNSESTATPQAQLEESVAAVEVLSEITNTGRPSVDAQQASVSSPPAEPTEAMSSADVNSGPERTNFANSNADPLNKLLESEDPSLAVGATELSTLQPLSPDMWMLSTFVIAFVFFVIGVGGILRLRQRAISSGVGQIRVLSRTALSKESGLAVIELEINDRPERYLIGFGGGSPRLVANLTGGSSSSNLSSFPDGIGALFNSEDRQKPVGQPEEPSRAMPSAELRDLWSQEPRPEVNVEVDFNGSESFEDFLNRIGRLDETPGEESSTERLEVGTIEANRTEIFDYLTQRTGISEPEVSGRNTDSQMEQMATNSPANSLFGELLRDEPAKERPARISGYSGSNASGSNVSGSNVSGSIGSGSNARSGSNVRRGIEAYRQPQEIENSPFQRMSVSENDESNEPPGEGAVADEDPWDSGFRRIAAQRGRNPGQ